MEPQLNHPTYPSTLDIIDIPTRISKIIEKLQHTKQEESNLHSIFNLISAAGNHNMSVDIIGREICLTLPERIVSDRAIIDSKLYNVNSSNIFVQDLIFVISDNVGFCRVSCTTANHPNITCFNDEREEEICLGEIEQNINNSLFSLVGPGITFQVARDILDDLILKISNTLKVANLDSILNTSGEFIIDDYLDPRVTQIKEKYGMVRSISLGENTQYKENESIRKI